MESFDPVSPLPAEPIPASQPPLALRLPASPPAVTYVLLALNILVFIAVKASVAAYGILIPAAVLQYGEWWRLVTAGFLHAGLVHLGFNMYALFVLGPDIERLFGSARFLAIYALALLGGSVLVTLFSPLNSGTLGASGAILGLMGGMVAYFWKYQERLSGGKERLWNIIMVVALNLGIGLLPGVSLWGHLGGFIIGLGSGWLLLPRYRVVSFPTPRLERLPLDVKAVVGCGLLFLAQLLLIGLAVLLRA